MKFFYSFLSKNCGKGNLMDSFWQFFKFNFELCREIVPTVEHFAENLYWLGFICIRIGHFLHNRDWNSHVCIIFFSALLLAP